MTHKKKRKPVRVGKMMTITPEALKEIQDKGSTYFAGRIITMQDLMISASEVQRIEREAKSAGVTPGDYIAMQSILADPKKKQ